jgi:hypothetical protein
MSANNLAAARKFRARLDPSRRHKVTRYFSVVSASHTTVTRFDRPGDRLTQVQPKSSGDGTVPIRSGAALPVQTGFVVADHVGVAKDDDSHTLMLMLFGLKAAGPVPLNLNGGAPAAPRLSVSPLMPAQGELWEIVLALPEHSEGFDGSISIEPEGAAGVPPLQLSLSVTAKGVTSLTLDGPPVAPGLYKVVLRDGDAVIQNQPLLVSSPVGAA